MIKWFLVQKTIVAYIFWLLKYFNIPQAKRIKFWISWIMNQENWGSDSVGQFLSKFFQNFWEFLIFLFHLS